MKPEGMQQGDAETPRPERDRVRTDRRGTMQQGDAETPRSDGAEGSRPETNEGLETGGRPPDDVTRLVIAACIEVHRQLGPGLLESSYETCVCHELGLRGLAHERQREIPIAYKGLKLDCGYRADLVVEAMVLVEI